MDKILATLRELEDACKVNLRYRHLMKNETPSCRTAGVHIPVNTEYSPESLELTAMHEKVLRNRNSTHGALLRMNRSIQAEGTFGVVKRDRGYRRIRRRGLEKVKLELLLVAVGHNLYKFHSPKGRTGGLRGHVFSLPRF